MHLCYRVVDILTITEPSVLFVGVMFDLGDLVVLPVSGYLIGGDFGCMLLPANFGRILVPMAFTD